LSGELRKTYLQGRSKGCGANGSVCRK
jgi:hypothetical protein